MKRLLFDIETNGLLDTMTKVHCIVAQDLDTDEIHQWDSKQGNLAAGITALTAADELLGHNIIAFDIPAIEKIYDVNLKAKVFDTMVVAKLIWAHRKELDFRLYEKGLIPGSVIGSHSLESWGKRLGELKDEYPQKFKEMVGEGYYEGMEWEAYSDMMGEYCVQDVKVNRKLLDKIIEQDYPEDPIRLEHEIHRICLQQTRNGFPFDMTRASALYGKLAQRRHEVRDELVKVFGSWAEPRGVVTPKRNLNYKDPLKASRVEGAPFTKFEIVEFNPASRQHIARCLTKKYGWKPKEFTDDGSPKVDESVLGKLKYPEASLLNEYLLLQKRIGQLAEGKEGWMSLVGTDGRIHGRVDTMGTVTSRCSHSKPNSAQVPSGKSPYGHECRELFHAPAGWDLLGCDVSGLELRMLAHYMAMYDGGEYAKILLEGDIHTTNQHAAGLPTRDNAKTFIYALLYGAGDQKIGSVIGKGAAAGKKLKEQFFEKTPALDRLRKTVSKAAARGWIKGIDGRKIPVRSDHAALNTLLQGGGGIICKRWVVIFHDLLKQRGYVEGKDYQQVAYVHDELQVLVRSGLGDEIGRICIEAIRLAGEYYSLRIRLDGEYKIGRSWAETH